MRDPVESSEENRRPPVIPVTQEDGKINGAASVAFEQIARGATEVVIEYAGHNYRLRATRNGRLVLNK